MAQPIRAPASHCSVSLDSQALYAEVQDWASLKARTNGPADGSSAEPAGRGPRRRGTGKSKVMMVDEGE